MTPEQQIRQKIAESCASGPVWSMSFKHVKAVRDRMIENGELARVKSPTNNARNMIGLTSLGAKRYDLTVPEYYLFDPQLRRRRKEREAVAKADGRLPDPEKRLEQKRVLAEHVAEGRSLNAAADVLGVSRNTVDRIWKEIQNDLGWVGD